jgi:hypothetical protein
VSFGGESALKADNLIDLNGLVIEPDGIEPTTSPIPLSWTQISDRFFLVAWWWRFDAGARVVKLIKQSLPSLKPRSKPYIEYDWDLAGFGVGDFR